MKNRRRSVPKKISSPRARTVLVGYPFFTQEPDRSKFSRQLAKTLEKETLFQGSSPVQWKAAPNPNPSWLYGQESDVGTMPISNFSATSYYARQGLLLPLDEILPSYSSDFLEWGWRKGIVG